jgi:hypothetical protein
MRAFGWGVFNDGGIVPVSFSFFSVVLPRRVIDDGSNFPFFQPAFRIMNSHCLF